MLVIEGQSPFSQLEVFLVFFMFFTAGVLTVFVYSFCPAREVLIPYGERSLALLDVVVIYFSANYNAFRVI